MFRNKLISFFLFKSIINLLQLYNLPECKKIEKVVNIYSLFISVVIYINNIHIYYYFFPNFCISEKIKLYNFYKTVIIILLN